MIATDDFAERTAYVTLALIPGIGPIRLDRIKRALGSYRRALTAPASLLEAVPSMNRAAASAVAAADRSLGPRAVEATGQLGGFLLTPFDADYPELLRHHSSPPALLFGLGRREVLTRPAVAIVGSRHPSSYGIAVARTTASGAARAGLTIVSGMARGLDAVAHWAALEAPGDTIGILGNGLGVIYPAANRTLYQRVGEAGLLLTEYPPGERPNGGSFQRRNRLISGLAKATFVVEATLESGALITASTAADEGRDVLAAPGQITSRTSAGTNRLIRDGATPFLELDDLLSRFDEIPLAVRQEVRSAAGRDPIHARLTADVRRVYDLLDSTSRSLDALVEELRIPPGDVIAAISELELGGLVESDGAAFRRAP